MTEQAKREPKDGELWWIALNHNVEHTVVAEWLGEQNNWFGHFIFDAESVTPIAPVASHELVRELVEALDKLARLGNGQHYGNSDGNCIAQAILAKAKLAGLDVTHD